jgi:putative ABC transport system permease protein
MDVWLGALNLGFLYAFMALGTYVTFRYFNIADITIDGSFTLGAATGALLISQGWNPLAVLPVSFCAGALAGMVTGIIHTRFRIDALLSGILVMTALYSVNLHVMGKSNIPLMNYPVFTVIISGFNPGINSELFLSFFLMMVVVILWIALSAFLKSDLGLSMMATGNNPVMIAAQGVSISRMKIIGIAVSNGLVGLSGILVAQYQGFADIGMGSGSIIYSLAAVIIGQALFRSRSVLLGVLGVILGAVIFRFAVAMALKVGIDPNDLKMLTAVFVLITLVISNSINKKKGGKLSAWVSSHRALLYGLIALFVAAWFAFRYFYDGGPGMDNPKNTRIGIVIANHSTLLVTTRDGFRDEMKRLGYTDGKNCEIHEENAEGDIPANKTIVDHLISSNTDIFVSISSASTQALANKVKDKPVIFATVADPFMLGVGTSPIHHPPNVTGVYGQAPVEDLLKLLVSFYPGKRTIGTIYNSGFPNTRSNLGALKKALKNFPDLELEEASVTGTGEVMQAAQSLASKKICAFLLINDLTVFDALESVVKVSMSSKIPTFACDAECLGKGVFLVYGYEYYISGVQAARMVDRVIRGESTASIPYEKFAHTILGVNRDLAPHFGLAIPESLLKRADAIIEKGKLEKKKFVLPMKTGSKPLRIAVFQYSSNLILDRATEGFRDYMIREKYIKGKNLDMVFLNAHGDYSNAQAIARDIVSENYNYIASFSTIALQVVAGVNTRIPHVFSAVTDPVKAGVAESLSRHRENLTGLATPQPVEETVKLMRTLLPRAKNIGIIWNASEINSEICTRKAREACKTYGFRLIERTVTGTSEVDESLNSLFADNIDILFISGDVTVSQMIPSLAMKARSRMIPMFTNTSDDIRSGAFISFGADYYEVGRKAAGILAGVIEGASPADIPIETYVPKALSVNLAIARELRIQIPDSLRKAASETVEK